MDSNTIQLRLATLPALDDILRDGARRALQSAIEREVQEYIDGNGRHQEGRRLVVRNGFHPARQIQTGSGSIEVRQPRVNDKRVDEQGNRFRFTSKILPPYLRKSKAIGELVPWLYLKGISSSDFPDALACLGHDGSGLSATSVVRMKEIWQGEYENFSRRSLEGKRYVYVWADGIYFNVRLTDDRPCVLVLMGATEDGTKELIAMPPIVPARSSEQSWLELLLDVKARGLTEAPRLATGDGALGFWKALRQVYPSTRVQRCWVHKTVNVLDKMARSQQPSAKSMLHEIWMSGTKEDAVKAFDQFVASYQAKYPKAVECLLKDREELLAFHDFPAEHWQHLRTTNPIESTFATVRLRTYKTNGAGSRAACLAMAFKLVESAQKHWRKLNGSTLLPEVVAGALFKDGMKVAA